MEVLYFGWVRQRIGVGREAVSPPAGVRDVAGLIAWLKTRSEAHARAFADVSALRAAVNQELAPLDAAIEDGDEVALFPPMTGGAGGKGPR